MNRSIFQGDLLVKHEKFLESNSLNIHAFFSGILHAPIAYLNHSKKMSLGWRELFCVVNMFSFQHNFYNLNISMAASKGLSLEPSISCHLTETSPSGICSISATLNHKSFFRASSVVEVIFLCNKWRNCEVHGFMTPTFNISTSKAHLSMWRVLKRTSAVFLFSSWKRIEISCSSQSCEMRKDWREDAMIGAPWNHTGCPSLSSQQKSRRRHGNQS